MGSESLTSRDSGSRNSLSSESSDSSVDRSVNRGGGRRQRRNTKHQHSAKVFNVQQHSIAFDCLYKIRYSIQIFTVQTINMKHTLHIQQR